MKEKKKEITFEESGSTGFDCKDSKNKLFETENNLMQDNNT